MSTSQPRWAPARLRDLFGKMLLTKRDMLNGFVRIPAGTKVTVDSGTAWFKLDISAARCECCGVQARISRVSIYDLMPLGSEPAQIAIPEQLAACQRPSEDR